MFGMGTGGSLRLLSPERSRAPASHCRALQLRRFGNTTASRLPSHALASAFARNSRLRTLKTAQVGFPSAVRPRQPPFFLSFFFLSQTFFQGFRFSFPAPRSALASPVPCSLIPVPSSQDQALDRLVSSSSIRYRTSTDDLSTLSSSRGLTCFIQWQFYSPGGLHA